MPCLVYPVNIIDNSANNNTATYCLIYKEIWASKLSMTHTNYYLPTMMLKHPVFFLMLSLENTFGGPQGGCIDSIPDFVLIFKVSLD